MTCYSIVLSLPPENMNHRKMSMNLKRLQVLLRSRTPYSAYQNGQHISEFVVNLCDEDAARLVKDIPAPFYVKSIRFLHTPEWILFVNRFDSDKSLPNVKLTTKELKDIYWGAKATERWTPRL